MDWTPIKVFANTILSYFSLSIRDNKISQIYYGGYNGVDQPLPIPNREVKRTCADGTALTRVGE